LPKQPEPIFNDLGEHLKTGQPHTDSKHLFAGGRRAKIFLAARCRAVYTDCNWAEDTALTAKQRGNFLRFLNRHGLKYRISKGAPETKASQPASHNQEFLPKNPPEVQPSYLRAKVAGISSCALLLARAGPHGTFPAEEAVP
jgi:hypothetical protein